MPDAHVHRLADANPIEAGGDPIVGRQLLMFNDDIEVSICKPTAELDGFYRNGEGDEVVYVHRGSGVAAHDLRPRAVPRAGLRRHPARHDAHVGARADGAEQFWVCFHTPGEIETPNRYRNRYGQLLEHAPFSQRDFHGPAELETYDETGEFDVTVRVRDGFQRYVLDRHPFDVVGWDGYVYPYTFNADDFEPRAGRFHLPPPAHQTFQGPNFVICTFAPRMLDWDPEAVPLPYHHSNIQSEEVMFYADGDYAARKGVDIGCLTLHPSGLPHGPQPGAVEKSLGATSHERARGHVGHVPPAEADDAVARTTTRSTRYSWNPDKSRPASTTALADSAAVTGRRREETRCGSCAQGAGAGRRRVRRCRVLRSTLLGRARSPAPGAGRVRPFVAVLCVGGRPRNSRG